MAHGHEFLHFSEKGEGIKSDGNKGAGRGLSPQKIFEH